MNGIAEYAHNTQHAIDWMWVRVKKREANYWRRTIEAIQIMTSKDTMNLDNLLLASVLNPILNPP